MANWTNPVLTSLYTDLLDILKDRDFDLATMFSPTYSAGTDIPEGAVRWNPTSKIWEIRTASATWAALSTKYNIDVDTLDGQHGSHYLDWNNFTNKPATFPATPHNHDDRYYTENEADGRYGFSIDASGNSIRLKNATGGVLSTLTVPYATSAGDAATVAGKSVNQNLRTTDAVTFASVVTSGDTTVKGDLFVGQNGGGNSYIHFYDDNGNTWRTLRWSDADNEWMVEDNGGTSRKLFHEGHLPTWSEVASKPSTFAPSAHGHVFNGSQRLQIRSETQAANDGLTGLAAELVYQNTEGRLVVHDGVTIGGKEVAFTEDIPGPTNLSSYARKDQAETFSGALTVNAALTSTGQIQMKTGRILDNSAAAAGKVMLSIEGDSDALQIINHAAGDYEIKNPGYNNSIRILDSSGGIQFRTNNATRLIINNSGIEVTGNITLNGETMWHSGNDGAGSGLDADKLDGVQLSAIPYATDGGVYGSINTGDGNGGANTLRRSTFYRDNNTHFGALGIHINHATHPEYALQIASPSYSAGGELRYRFLTNGVWSTSHSIWSDANHGAGSGLDADKLDGIHASSFVRNDSSQTMYNTLTIADQAGTIGGGNWNNGWFRIGDSASGWSFDNNEMYNGGAGIIGTLAGNLDFIPAGNLTLKGSRIFADSYHPNADKWTTARTITLAGDATGSVSIDGSANKTLTVNVMDDSHNHVMANIDEFSKQTGGELRITTPSGYIDLGPKNTSYCHIYTDRPSFYFNKELRVLGNQVFHAGYHPNADKLTTARTINLGGDVSGSASFNGSANITITATVDKVDGFHAVKDSYTANQIGVRNSSGDIHARLFRSNYGDSSSIASGAAVMMRVNTSDNYLRPINPAGFMAWLKNHDGAGSGLDADLLDGLSSASFLRHGHYTHNDGFFILNRNSANSVLYVNNYGTGPIAQFYKGTASGQTSGTKMVTIDDNANIISTGAGRIEVGVGSGSVAMTINDGGGNSNLTFNHTNKVPDQNGNAARIEVNTDASSGAAMYFELKSNVTGGVSVGLNTGMTLTESALTVTGDITSSSDRKLKTNIQRIEGALDKVEQLTGVVYDRIDSGQRQTGLIAQDVQKVLPEAVSGDETLSVAYGQMMGLIVEAIKELREMVLDR